MSVLRVLLLGAGICLLWLFWQSSPEPRKDTTSATEMSQPMMTPVSAPSPQPPPSTKHRADVGATSTTVPVPVPADFVRLDGDELILALDAMGQLNDAGRIDFFARQLRAEPRSDLSLQAEQQLTELLQNKVQIFRQSALSRIDCGEFFCLVVAPVPQQDALFNEFQRHSKTLSFGSGGFYNFESNGELYNGLVLSLKENTSLQ
ncbi:hypothetical protein [Rheinheimera tilapiae]|uniref:Cell division protein ZipA n=1 Tax=Rheinheimera tilapiae TaxID=875043 RepID=A0ABV6BER4_9GAMM